MRRGQLGGRRRQYLRGKRQLPRSHHSAAGCVNNVHVWICVSGEKIVSTESSGMGEDLDHSLAYMVHYYLTMSLYSTSLSLTAWVDLSLNSIQASK